MILEFVNFVLYQWRCNTNKSPKIPVPLKISDLKSVADISHRKPKDNVAEFTALSDERMSRSKIFHCLLRIKGPSCPRKIGKKVFTFESS